MLENTKLPKEVIIGAIHFLKHLDFNLFAYWVYGMKY